jgi:hypothetical protein
VPSVQPGLNAGSLGAPISWKPSGATMLVATSAWAAWVAMSASSAPLGRARGRHDREGRFEDVCAGQASSRTSIPARVPLRTFLARRSLFLRSVLLTMQPAVPGFYVSAPVTESRVEHGHRVRHSGGDVDVHTVRARRESVSATERGRVAARPAVPFSDTQPAVPGF